MAWLGLAREGRRLEKEKVTIDPKTLSVKGRVQPYKSLYVSRALK